MTLHCHSEHSHLDGRARTAENAQAAKQAGFDAVAITDHDEVGGHLDHQKACAQHGVKPIFGTEARWLHSIPASREAKTSGRDASHIILLAADQTGLRNLWALSSLAYEPENFYGKPQLDPTLLRPYSEGLFSSDGCGLTRFAEHVSAGDEDAARREWAVLLDIFGDRFYSELHTFQIIDPVTDEDKALNAKITAMNQAKVRFAKEMGVPLVVVNDSHYAQKQQWEEHRLVYNLSTQAYKKDQVEAKGQAADWLMSPDEMVFFMGRHGIPRSVTEEAIRNIGWISDQCNVEIRPTLAMPRLYPTDAEDAAAFRSAIEEGFKRFVVDKGLPENLYRERLEYEARLIVDKGMCFPAGTLVTTGAGSLVPIEQMAVGDRILTRSGSQPVGRVMRRDVDESLVTIRVAGSFRPLTATGNHPVLTSAGWMDMDEVTVGVEVAVDLVPESSPLEFDLAALAIGKGWGLLERDGLIARAGTGRGRAARQHVGWMPAKMEASADLMYVIGLWVAEGHLVPTSSDTSPGQIGWTLHVDEDGIAERLQAALTRMGCGTLRRYEKASVCAPNHRGVTYMLTNHPLALLLETLVGHGVQNKCLDDWIIGQSSEVLAHLVRGWADGDGTYISGKNKTVVYTVNDTLAYQLRQIMLRQGVWTTETVDNRGCRLVKWVSDRRSKPRGARFDGKRWWAQVKAVTSSPYRGTVYNLSVDGDPTYIANGVRVHNCGYFNVVGDYVMAARDGSYARWINPSARPDPCLCGPGRGSGGGSLVNYVLGITSLDPIKYDLMFERFINPDRPDYPDIDVDFQKSKRPAVKEYLGKRYGEHNVCSIGTRSRSGPKQMLKDLCRAMSIPWSDTQKMVDLIEEVDHIEVDEDLDPDAEQPGWDEVIARLDSDLAPWARKYPEMFARLENMVGLVRQAGVHAAGVVVNTEPLLGNLPTRVKKGVRATQFDMHECVHGDSLVGGRPIRDLVDSHPEVLRSLNEDSGEMEDNAVVRVISKGTASLVRIRLVDGKELRCTSDHLIRCRRGWVPAGSLTSDDEVMVDGG